VSSVAYSPDGRFVVSGSADSSVKIWDLATGRELWTLPEHDEAVRSVAYSPDGRRVVSGSADHLVKLWDAETGEEFKSLFGHDNAVNSVDYSPDGRFVVSGSVDRTVRVWDAETGVNLRTYAGHSLRVNAVCYRSDGRAIASASRDGTVKLWDAESGELLRDFAGHVGELLSLRCSPDNRFVASGSSNGFIILWDVESGEARNLPGHEGAARALAFSPDGRRLASASNVDSTIKIWDVSTGRRLRSFNAPGMASLSYSPDGRHIVSGSMDNTVRVWDVETGAEILSLEGRSSWVRSVAYSPEGGHIAMGSTDRTIHIWEAGSGREIMTLAGHTATVRSVTYSPDGKRIVSGAADSTVRVWDAASGRELQTLRGHSSVVKAVDYDPLGQFIVSGSSDASIKVWNAETGEERRAFTGHTGAINALAFSPDGFTIASGSSDGTVKLWDARGGAPRTLRGHALAVVSVSYSEDGARLVSGSTDGTIKLWDLESGRELHTLPGYSTHIKSGLSFGAGGASFAAAMADHGIVIFDAANAGRKRLLRGHADAVYDLAYSPDGKRLVSASLDGTVRIWDLATGRELVQSVGFSNGEWISVTPDGYYTASALGDRYFNIRSFGNVYGLELWRPAFYNPLLVRTRLQGGRIRGGRSLRNINTLGAPPSLDLFALPDDSGLEGAAAELVVSAADTAFPLRDFRIHVNDRLIGPDMMGGLIGANLRITGTGISVTERMGESSFLLPLELEAGRNRIEATVSDGVFEGRATVTVETPPQSSRDPARLPNLKLLAIGASRYDEPRIDHVGFASFDAQAIADLFKSQEGKLYGTVSSLLIATGEPLQPTKNNILREIAWFFQDLGSRDTALLFLSGHGANDNEGNYYFLPSDIRLGADGGIPYEEALSVKTIAEAMDVPGRKLLFIDTSHTPGISAANVRAVDLVRLAMDLKPIRPLLFASARGEELSRESEEHRAGLFTHAIKEGLSGAADADNDGIIIMKELAAYVSGRVADLSFGLQRPSTNAGSYDDFALHQYR
jgi:WD40 repeat protein